MSEYHGRVKITIVIPFLLMLLALQAQASLYLNVSIMHHKGIDKGITLLSEFHSKEEILPKKELHVKMRDGVELFLNVNFPGEEDLYGPSGRLAITGKILSETGDKYTSLGDKAATVLVGEEIKFEVKDQIGQLIEVSIKPEFR